MSGAAGLLFFRLTQYALLFAASVLVTRLLGPAGRAQYALPLAWSSGVWILGHLTLDAAAARATADGQTTRGEIAAVLVVLWCALSAALTAAAFAMGAAVRNDLLAGASLEVVAMACAQIPALLATQYAGFFLLLEGSLRTYGLNAVLAAICQLAAISVLATAGAVTPESATASTALGSVVLGLLHARAARRGHLPGRANRAVTASLLGQGAMLHPMSLAIQLGPRVDLLIVGGSVSRQAAGNYSLASTLADTTFVAAQTITQAALQRQMDTSEAESRRFTVRFVRRIIAVATIAVLVVAASAPFFIPAIYGPEWQPAVLPFILLAAASLAMAIEGPLRQFLIRSMHPAVVSSLALFGLALNVGLTALLVRLWGIDGAALASVIAFWIYGALVAVAFTRSGRRATA